MYSGRNPIYLGTLLVFVALQAPTALSVNFGMLCAFRFITGFFGSPVLATGGATLSDIWRPAKRAYAMSIWGIAAICGPTRKYQSKRLSCVETRLNSAMPSNVCPTESY